MEHFDNEHGLRYFEAVESNSLDTSSSFSNPTRNDFIQTDKSSIANIIEKHKIIVDKSNNYLHRNVGNHALFAENIEITRSMLCNVSYEEYEKVNNKNNEMDQNYINYISHRHEADREIPNDIKDRLTSNEKLFLDKTTYCRPVIHYYNEQFLYKTMERNAKLKRLVRKLAIARQKEKETVSWNNFINELKTKHGLQQDQADKYVTPDIIDDYYNTKFSCAQSRPCKHLLQEFYECTNDASQSSFLYCEQLNENTTRQSDAKTYFPHERNPYCYPTSSQGRLIMMERKRRFKQHLSDNNVYAKSEINKPYLSGAVSNEMREDNSYRSKRDKDYAKSTSVQTDIKFYPNFISNKYQDKATCNVDDLIGGGHKYDIQNDVTISTENNKNPRRNLKQITLVNIDTKLETLIESINMFIDEIKLNKSKRKVKEQNLKLKNNINNENIKSKEDSSINKAQTVEVVNSVTRDTSDYTNNSYSNFNSSHWPLKMNKVLEECNMYNSKSMQMTDSHNKQPCSVQITFEVPTRDCSTEVTRSLSKQNCSDNREKIIEEISTPEHIMPLQRMTIAVNTDPLSILGLLKVSTDTFKCLLSYMPNFDYYSYLSQLQLPLTLRKIEPHYVCNICGADFNQPSRLSDHIREHNLGKTKDCCVCRHVVDTSKKSGLFRCRYCGQLFARAYCCELHQESCARRLGRQHDVTPSLLLLR